MKRQQLLDKCFQELLNEKKTICKFSSPTELVQVFSVLRKTDYGVPVWVNKWCALLTSPEKGGTFLSMATPGMSLFLRVKDNTGRIEFVYSFQ